MRARLQSVATLVGWQLNKVNSPVCPLSILHRRRMDYSYTAQPTVIHKYELVVPQTEQSKDLFCIRIILRLLTDLETI